MPERFERKEHEFIELQSGYEGAEEQIIHNSTRLLRIATKGLYEGSYTVDQWRDLVERVIVSDHVNALSRGLNIGPSDLTDEHKAELKPIINNQLSHLNRWAEELQALPDGEMPRAHISRVDQYGTAAAISFRLGQTYPWPLPAHPGEGSLCRVYCKCKWRIEVISFESGDADAYWELGVTEHCDTCISRNAEWSPYKIRNGVRG